MINHGRLRASIETHDGTRLKPYLDSEGFWTIGVGRYIHHLYGDFNEFENWISNGITSETASKWLDEDITKAHFGAMDALGTQAFQELSDVRQEVLIEMAFQMGGRGLRSFKKTLAFIREGEHVAASNEMLDSKWHRKQTPKRAETLAERFRSNQYES